MLFVSLGLVLLATLLSALVMRSLLATRAALDGAMRAEHRYRSWSAERDRYLRSRTNIANAAQSTTEAVQLGSAVTQTGHQAIAGIPFGIIGAIPGLSKRSNRVRDVHDSIAEAVYGTIAAVSEGISEASRRALTGEEPLTSPDADESAPPEPPTPPADRPR